MIATAGTWPRRCAAITARVLLMPSATDLYFRVADNEAELAHLRHGELATIPSIWGHWAGSPQVIPADLEFLTATSAPGWTAEPRPAARPRPIPPARAARPQKIKGISIFVDCWYSG